MRTTLHVGAVALVALASALMTMFVIAAAQTSDASDVAEGMRLYLQKGDCQSCHGWAADGR